MGKCPSCEAVLYATDLDNNLQVCPKCSHHNRLRAQQPRHARSGGRFEIGAEGGAGGQPKFKDSKRYIERLMRGL